jgi:ABC-type uncharacterized transport system substrate-binding protein
MSRYCIASCASLLALASPAAAHPHVWIAMQTSVVFDDAGMVTGVGVEWTFDDAYAQVALEGMDKNGDGVYGPDELEALTRENLDSLKDYGYFIFMDVDGKQQQVAAIRDAGQVYSNDKLTLHFTAALAKPVDPRKQQFEVKVYDPEFYISFEYFADEPTDHAGKLPQGCAVEVKPLPTTAELESTKSMLATKGADWKPADESQQFGSMFAQPVSVECKPS